MWGRSDGEIPTCMSRVLSDTQNSFEKSLANITLADLVGEIREKTA